MFEDDDYRFEHFGAETPEKLANTLEAIVYMRRCVALNGLLDIAEQLVDYFDFFEERSAYAFIKRYCPKIHIFQQDGTYRCRYRIRDS